MHHSHLTGAWPHSTTMVAGSPAAAGPGGARVPAIEIDGQAVAYTIRRSARAKRLQLRYLPAAGFEVVLPPLVPLRDVEPFLRAAARWMRRMQHRAAQTTAEPALALADGAALPYVGSSLKLRVIAGPRDTIQRDG